MRRRTQYLLLKYRLPAILLAHLTIGVIGYVLALGLRFDFDLELMTAFQRMELPLALLLLFRTFSYTFWNLNRGYWRYSSVSDLINLIKAHSLTSVLFAASIFILRLDGFPRSVIFIEFAISVMLSGGGRLATRLLCEKFLERQGKHGSSSLREVIVLGAGESGHLLIRNLQSGRMGYKAVGVLDDNEWTHSLLVSGVPVLGGLTDLEAVLERLPRVTSVICAIPSLSLQRYKNIESICRKIGVPLKRLQSFEDLALIDSGDTVERLTIESVLEKEINVEHEDEIRRAVHGKRALVTGAGGSIGSELVRQIAPFNPSRLILLDNCEYNLFRIEREVRREHPELAIRAVLANVCDSERIERVFLNEAPDLIFHAAAFKHVSLVEGNAYAAFLNNVLGTRRVLKAALKSGASRFVLVSTDKAVEPSSVMGVSKRLAELIVQSVELMREESAGDGIRLNTAIVRFGNVINSNGSVIPLFKEQILSGGPLTVTHPDVERYFMSVREAVRLVLTAGTLGSHGEVYILDMGSPVRIVDVAKKMLALYGRRDIAIEFTGLRQGEKMNEKLSHEGEHKAKTRFKKVFSVGGDSVASGYILQKVEELERRLSTISDEVLGAAMFRLAEESFDNLRRGAIDKLRPQVA
ncbi:MAG: polysaccharide biosynthesis protein [Deltaproteobacteria bacterium]|nr:polysaccharide biosynthesis protein [Deltaproteobacteria bacterium]